VTKGDRPTHWLDLRLNLTDKPISSSALSTRLNQFTPLAAEGNAPTWNLTWQQLHWQQSLSSMVVIWLFWGKLQSLDGVTSRQLLTFRNQGCNLIVAQSLPNDWGYFDLHLIFVSIEDVPLLPLSTAVLDKFLPVDKIATQPSTDTPNLWWLLPISWQILCPVSNSRE
jgi:hypothetical protein